MSKPAPAFQGAAIESAGKDSNKIRRHDLQAAGKKFQQHDSHGIDRILCRLDKVEVTKNLVTVYNPAIYELDNCLLLRCKRNEYDWRLF